MTAVLVRRAFDYENAKQMGSILVEEALPSAFLTTTVDFKVNCFTGGH